MFLVLLSLTPIIWFAGRPGVLINGVDTNFPLDPAVWFTRRFFVWTNVGNLGSDFSASTAGTFFHLLQFIPYKLGFPLQTVELLSLIFWFGLIIFSSWFLARQLFPKKSFPQLIFVCLYSLNIYLFNSFENVKVANLSLVSSIPLALSILILLRNKKITRVKAFLFSLATGLILAGSGINPSYIISFFLILMLYVLSEIVANINSYKKILDILKDFLLVSLGLISVNLFWILPSIAYIFTDISTSNSIGSIGFTNWVNSLSQNTSLVNVLRMQGAWDWYSVDQVTGLPLYIPYATRYFTNPFFIGFSFFIPALAFLAYVFRKSLHDNLHLFFGMALVIGLFLTAGTHTPTGGIFSFFGRHIPFFSLFRSPWYIFAPLVGLSIAGLVGLFIDRVEDITTKKVVIYFFSIIFTFGILVYSYPLILGKIFRPNFQGSFYIKFPSYVFDTKNYLSGSNDQGRILSYPDDNIERFAWGYSGVDSILNLFSDNETVFSPLNNTLSPVSKNITGIYSSLKKEEIAKANSLANTFGIDRIFYKKDQVSFASNLPAAITSHKLVSFGDWSFYQFPSAAPEPKVYTANSLLVNMSNDDSSGSLSLIDEKQILVNPKDSFLTKIDLTENSGYIIKAINSHQSEVSAFEINPHDLNFKVTKRNIENVEYDFNIQSEGEYQPILENYQLNLFGIINQNKINTNLDGLDTTLSIDHSDNSYLYLSAIKLKEGAHKLIIHLVNKNLVGLNNYTVTGNAKFDSTSDVLSILNKSDKNAFFSFKISDFDPYSAYLIKVDSKYDYGKSPEVSANQMGNTQIYKSQQEVLPIYTEFGNYNFYLLPVNIPSTGEVNLSAPFTRDPQGTKVEFKNLSVSKMFTNDLFFKKEPDNSFDPAIVAYNKKSPIFYSGEVKNSKGPQIIVFNENYSPEWQLTVDGVNAKIFHFTANTYANAWYVDVPIDSYRFTIFYKPQRFQDIGKLVGIITVIIGLGWYLFTNIKNKK